MKQLQRLGTQTTSKKISKDKSMKNFNIGLRYAAIVREIIIQHPPKARASKKLKDNHFTTLNFQKSESLYLEPAYD